jgi:hypothetical protein
MPVLTVRARQNICGNTNVNCLRRTESRSQIGMTLNQKWTTNDVLKLNFEIGLGSHSEQTTAPPARGSDELRSLLLVF